MKVVYLCNLRTGILLLGFFLSKLRDQTKNIKLTRWELQATSRLN
jgi:hypothetical protein